MLDIFKYKVLNNILLCRDKVNDRPIETKFKRKNVLLHVLLWFKIIKKKVKKNTIIFNDNDLLT